MEAIFEDLIGLLSLAIRSEIFGLQILISLIEEALTIGQSNCLLWLLDPQKIHLLIFS